MSSPDSPDRSEPDTAPPTGEPDLRPSAVHQLVQGDRLGRYVLLSKLGEGGMGVVYAAYDPELDRKVALKILSSRFDVEDTRGTVAQNRLLREAQAMARVKHPNVVTVYEVGTIDAKVFVAMELVDGQTLGRWFRDTPRPWRELVQVFIEAGKGLAAAHSAGLVHRDFKPDNVLVSRDGRVQVTDFGLARLVAGGSDDPQSGSDERPEGSLLERQVTLMGTLVGTPQYMSPEQHLRKVPDARSDQFSYCATLYWALFRTRPFEPRTLAEHVARSRGDTQTPALATPLGRTLQTTGRATTGFGRGVIHEPPREPRVPGWLKQVLRRGLAIDPNDRFPSMEALLGQLEQSPRRQRRRLLAGAGGAVVLAATASVWGALAQRRALCNVAPDRLANIWDGAVHQKVRTQLAALQRPWAAEAAEIATRRLDAYAGEWAAMFKEACTATRVKAEQPEAVMALRMTCLDKRLGELGALTQLLGSGNPDALGNAVDAVNALSGIGACADVALLSAPVRRPSDPQVQAHIAAIEAELSKVKILFDTAQYKEALPLAAEAELASRAIDYPPLQATALRWLGTLQSETGDSQLGEDSLRRAALAADAGKDDEERVRAAIELEWTVGHRQGRFADGLTWAAAADAILRRIGGNDALTLDVRNVTGSIYYAQGKYAEALSHYREAQSLAERVLDSHNPLRARIIGNLAAAYSQVGDVEQATALSQLSLQLLAGSVGREHPRNAVVQVTLADLLLRKGDHAAALEHATKAMGILERSDSANTQGFASAVVLMATIYLADGRYQEALGSAQQALKILQKLGLAPDHNDFAISHERMGRAYLGLKDYPRAIEALQRSIAIKRKNGATAAKLAYAHFALAQALWDGGGDRRTARAEAQASVEGFQALAEGDRLKEANQWLADHPPPQ